MKQLALVAVLGACTGEGNQLVIQLDGPVMARQVELVFVDPHVFIKRDQRINMPPIDPAREPAFYVFQRSKLDIVLEGEVLQPVDDVEIQVVGAEGLLPIAIARDEQDAIVGMGVLDPERVFRDDDDNEDNFVTNLQELADITRYPITVEPTTELNSFSKPGQPVSVASGEVRGIRCMTEQLLSGIVWRPQVTADGIQRQLRIAKAFDDGDALERVEREGFDLDCDGHTPSIRGFVPEGDQEDCDDTAALVSRGPGRAETCDNFDNDCDPSTMGVTVMPGLCAACVGNMVTCVEGIGADIDINSCSTASQCLQCLPHTQIMATWAARASGDLPLPGECGDECVIRVAAVDPRWDVRIGDPGDPKHGLFDGYTPIGPKLGITIVPIGNPLPQLPNGANDFGGVTLVYQPSPTSRVFVLEVLFLESAQTTHDEANACTSPFELMPPCGPNT